MLIITAIVLLVSLGAVLMWNEGGVTKTVTIGQTQSEIFETFSIGQIINNYIIDSSEISRCNAMHSTAKAWEDGTLPTSSKIKEYFEDRYRESLLVYMADFPPISDTSLQSENSLYTNLFFQTEFDYENNLIKGGPQKVRYSGEEETEIFIDFLEILSKDGYMYKIRPVYSIEFQTEYFDYFETMREWSSGTPQGFKDVGMIGETNQVLATTDLKCLGKNVQIIFTP